MSSLDGLETAIQAAREGRKAEARDLLIKLVETDPQNEMAWMWLAGLVDSLEDRMIACENVLTINPANQKVRAYLEKLQQQQKSLSESKNRDDAKNLVNRAREHVERNEVDVALRLANQAVETHDSCEEAWLLVGRLSSNVDQQIRAFEKAHQLNPLNKKTASTLEQLQHLKADPMSAARRLEQLGQFEEALNVYQELASKAQNPREFDHIYKQIIRIEGYKQENIRYVAPASSIVRLTFTWPLLYLSLALIQMGLNPFAHFVFYLWLGLPLVITGSFLLSLAEVGFNHIVWQKLFGEQGDGSQLARFVAVAAGWFLVIIPHVLLVMDSLNRLQNFKIPPVPF